MKILSHHFDKIGTLGATLAAAMAPCCFPLLGVVASALGLTALERYAPVLVHAVVAFAGLGFVGTVIAWRTHRRALPPLLSGAGFALVLSHEWLPGEGLTYAGLALLAASALLGYFAMKGARPVVVKTRSTITCPKCGFQKEETMPTDACVWAWTCPHCGVLLKAKPGDCCVFCSYGSEPCPPIQQAGRDACGCH